MPQVLVGFIGTGVLVVVLLFNYLIAHDPEVYPFSTNNDAYQRVEPPEWWKPNPVDILFLSWIRKIARKCPSSWHIDRTERIEMAFSRVCLLLITSRNTRFIHFAKYEIVGYSGHV